MGLVQFRIATAAGAIALLLLLGNVVLVVLNRDLQHEVAARQQFVQQSVQLEGLYREIVRALAELGARNNDADVRALLLRHGITYSVNPPAASPAPAGPTPPARK